MIEVIIKQFLDGNIKEPSFFELKADLPERFIVIQRVGGDGQYALKKATIACQSYAESMYEAASLNERVKEVVANMIDLENITKVKLNSDYNFTDTETKHYRYQAIFEIYYY